MEKVREDFDHIKAALDEMLYYNPEELERQADEYEREMARKEGKEEGLKEGKEIGKIEMIKEIIFNMLKLNYSINDICKSTNLSYEEVNNIIKNNKN